MFPVSILHFFIMNVLELYVKQPPLWTIKILDHSVFCIRVKHMIHPKYVISLEWFMRFSPMRLLGLV